MVGIKSISYLGECQVKGLFCLGVLCLLATACAGPSISYLPNDVRVAMKQDVNDCEPMGDVHGISSLYGVFAKNALATARKMAIDETRILGGNTVVWYPFQTQVGSTSVHGAAYFCEETF